MNWHSIIDAMVETETEPTPTPTPTPQPLNMVQPITKVDTGLPPPTTAQPILSGNYQNARAVPQVESFLATLRDKLAPVGDSIAKLDTILASLTAIPEGSLRVSTAIGVLKATAGITLETLQNAYRARLAALDVQEQAFATAVAQQTAAEITRREDAAKQITAQLQQLTQQREFINAELVTARTKISAAEAGFTGALAALKQELTEAANRLTTTTGATQ